MSRISHDHDGGFLSRKRTAELLKQLRDAAKEARILKMQADLAQQEEPEEALRLLRQERASKGR